MESTCAVARELYFDGVSQSVEIMQFCIGKSEEAEMRKERSHSAPSWVCAVISHAG